MTWLTERGGSHKVDGRDCVLVDRWDLRAQGKPMQVDCLTCGKSQPEGNRYACTISDEELAEDWRKARQRPARAGE